MRRFIGYFFVFLLTSCKSTEPPEVSGVLESQLFLDASPKLINNFKFCPGAEGFNWTNAYWLAVSSSVTYYHEKLMSAFFEKMIGIDSVDSPHAKLGGILDGRFKREEEAGKVLPNVADWGGFDRDKIELSIRVFTSDGETIEKYYPGVLARLPHKGRKSNLQGYWATLRVYQDDTKRMLDLEKSFSILAFRGTESNDIGPTSDPVQNLSNETITYLRKNFPKCKEHLDSPLGKYSSRDRVAKYAKSIFIRKHCFLPLVDETEFSDAKDQRCFLAAKDLYEFNGMWVVDHWDQVIEQCDRHGASQDIATDLKIIQKKRTGLGNENVHRGFLQSLNTYITAVENDRPIFDRPLLITEWMGRELTKSPDMPFFITGHSLGGAVAHLAAAHVLDINEIRSSLGSSLVKLKGVYTFGKPRVGGRNFKKSLESRAHKQGAVVARFRNNTDIVTRVPSLGDYYHAGLPLYFRANGELVKPINHKLSDQGFIENYKGGIVGSDHSILKYMTNIENQLIQGNKIHRDSYSCSKTEGFEWDYDYLIDE